MPALLVPCAAVRYYVLLLYLSQYHWHFGRTRRIWKTKWYRTQYLWSCIYTRHTILYSQLLFSSPATQPVDLSNSVGLLYSIYNTSQIALRPKTSAAIKQLFFSLSQCLIWKLIKSACVTLVFKQVLKSLTRVSKLHKSSDKSCA